MTMWFSAAEDLPPKKRFCHERADTVVVGTNGGHESEVPYVGAASSLRAVPY